MFTNIDEAITWIINRRNENSTFESFKAVCDSLGNPQDNFYTIHVTGTDGKGSTVTYLRDLLMNHGLKVGTLQSPHYLVHQDRIRINNINIEDEAFLRILNKHYDFFIEKKLNMFEMDFLIMADYFKENKVDVAIVEVGIGGRLDATNTINNTKLSIITTIGYDHMERLGNTLEEICYEKCGIIKNNSRILVGHINDNLKDLVKQIAYERNSEYYELSEYKDLGERHFEYEGDDYYLSSYAKYQMHNSALALKAFKIVSNELNIVVDAMKVKESLKNTSWPCRFELVKENPNIFLDGAHNIHGVEALCESVDSLKGSKCIIFSALERKEYKKMIDLLSKHCDELVLTTFNYPGIYNIDEYRNTKYRINIDYKDAIKDAKNKYDNIIICGSLYFLSDVVINLFISKEGVSND